MKKDHEFEVVDRPARIGKPPVWAGMRERLKALPDKKSIRMRVPKGKTIRQFAQHVRAGIIGANGFPVTVSEAPQENAIYVWEKREPYKAVDNS